MGLPTLSLSEKISSMREQWATLGSEGTVVKRKQPRLAHLLEPQEAAPVQQAAPVGLEVFIAIYF